MRIKFYSTKAFETEYLITANTSQHQAVLDPELLSEKTVHAAKGFEAISVFTADDVSAPILEILKQYGVKHVATRAAGYDNIDISKARELSISVANVPEYSPYAIAEHAIALLLAVNRKLITANNQVQKQNFIVDNLIGFDLFGKTAGIIGTGRTGAVAAKILNGFGCKLLGHDLYPDENLSKQTGLTYVDLKTLCEKADFITIHTSLNEKTKYLINEENLSWMKDGVILINTARGGIIQTEHLINALEQGKISGVGLDVYENEKGIFFFDHSNKAPQDELLQRLMAFPNVLITPHQAFATREALQNIADTTFENIDNWASGLSAKNELTN